MAFLAVAGVTVSVAQDSVRAPITEIGDRARTFSGTLRETIRNRVTAYTGRTIPISRTDATTQLAALNKSTQPQGCTGDLLSTSGGTVSLFTRGTVQNFIQADSTSKVIISFTLEETS